MAKDGKWKKALEANELADGEVTTVQCAGRTLCLTKFKGEYAALDNKCPHQGGPLGEGSIEDGWLRCPWHGWDFHPTTGESPEGLDDKVETFPVEVREDGVYVSMSEEETHERTASDVLVETLVNWGLRQVFGMVGHSNLGVADAIRLQALDGKLSYYGIRHEGAAAFAASAYGKLTGRPAACLAIAGPGATNLLTGLWDAHVDSAPVLALTGQVPTHLIGRGAFQEVDLVAAFGGVATYTGLLYGHSDFAEIGNLAAKHALMDQGVSHIVLPDDVQIMPAKDVAAGAPDGRWAPAPLPPAAEPFAAALALLTGAERPVIIVGDGARPGMDSVTALAEHLGCPIVTTFKAKGVIPDAHPLAGGVLGRSGTPIASWCMNEADLLVVFGASFSNHTGIDPKQPILQVDTDPAGLGRHHPVTLGLRGDAALVADGLVAAMQDGQWTDQRADIAERWTLWRQEKARRAAQTGTGMASAKVFASLSEGVPEDAIIAVDVGNNTYSFGRYFECGHQHVLMSGYLGSIGFGFPAAMGAWAATTEQDSPHAGRKVVSISGDGGFGQYLAELTTAVNYGMDITHVLLNNGELGKISKEQRAGDWKVWQTGLHNPNFAEYAKLCGAWGRRVQTIEEFEQAFAEALAHDGPALIEVLTDPLLI
jgi:thiamine pyrophosphate-dependent acetolactate synthase large subunit-like protein/nitrite reductase/ring-hydroxylating ferredoxin subunit